MSHFACLVTGPNIEAQLAPFDEALETEPSKVYLNTTELADIAAHYRLDPNDRRAIVAHMEDWNGREGGVDRRGVYGLSTSNPDAKWDWWEVGGRFRGFFTPKPGKGGVLGGTGTPDAFVRRHGDAAPEPTGVDEILKGDVDIAAMEAASEAEARRTWAAYATAIAGTPEHVPWRHFAQRIDAGEISTEDARSHYNEQPRVAAFNARRSALGIWTKPEDFPGSEAAYVRRERDRALCPFAVLHDGVWHEKGSMGWFGFAADEKATDVWAREFRRLWDSWSDGTRLAIVDCHI
ncbi:MAG: hypothetical protein DIJKHBIC_02302 [Thermoanaerobaculia bacterium]|nr:hypothetical protein [Thermoanaerobaculia bacterium]